MEKRLIVNADDYGLTPGAAAGIRQAHLRGIVTSTTAMMNKPQVEEAIQLALRDCPNLGLGVHLVLTSGKPVLPPDRIPSLVTPDGLFFHQEDFIARLASIDPEDAFSEWHAQIEAFAEAAGRAPDHIDSHHHASYFSPVLFERMLALAEEYGCPIRKPFGEHSASYTEYLSTESDAQYEPDVAALVKRYQTNMPQVFIGDFYDDGATLSNLGSIIQSIASDNAHDTFEIMCHPAVVDEDLRRMSSYQDPRARELAILQSDDVKGLIRQHHIQLINFSDLAL